MKKNQIAKLCMAACLVLGMFMIPANRMEVRAAASVMATVQGTVMSGTTAELLKLSTKEGDMEIKLDSGTDTSACKILLPDYKISVSVSHGSDGYLHAVKITTEAQTPAVTLDFSTSANVTGTIGDKTTSEILYFNTQQGEMEIKLDATTNMSGCSVLVVDKSYSITCVRGSDAYMHAVSISDAGMAAGTSSPSSPASPVTPSTTVPVSSGLTPAPTGTVTAATGTVSGTVAENTKENLLYLSTKDGEMQFAIDSSTDARSGVVLTPGNKLTVSFYHGSDAYLHAVSLSGQKDAPSMAQMDTSDVATVTGTVGDESSESVLYLDTPQGEMQLKLDAVNSISNCKVFVAGKKLSLTCTRGSDAYMHAIDITGM
jgi:hypothetical protein